jgi:hypothetical protein
MEAVQVNQRLSATYLDDPDVFYTAGQLYGKLSSASLVRFVMAMALLRYTPYRSLFQEVDFANRASGPRHA